ncbi:uncharacterized protein MELLADRAFT_111071 [Melampsora larici-populina 98AG31]|uniref:Uncharacterized protein n=1 Tax=Melampsora larici-populina (strain 98AG31 / pathotype 3-4-7) TaxID=747676 RepID=F4S1Y5_MELLP|nr:uncharacterized protein MELLADRAFT_111071 [Melampsora larici-populina 98AG31]EGG01357.1 hypothetical protein MELLADRAFT_111071 [Melampsora larici-populina 98AG31]
MPPAARPHSHLTHRHIGPASTPFIDASLSRSASPDRTAQKRLSSGDNLTLQPDEIYDKTEGPPRSGDIHQEQVSNEPSQAAPLPSMMTVGILLLITSATLWIFGFCILLTPPNGRSSSSSSSTSNWIEKFSTDNHYKYLFPLQFTLGLVFVIVNWGGLIFDKPLRIRDEGIGYPSFSGLLKCIHILSMVTRNPSSWSALLEVRVECGCNCESKFMKIYLCVFRIRCPEIEYLATAS